MELRHLKYFMRAAELLHFTRAAESLYISQPSLSVHIQQLEEELKTKLFARVGRNVRLTDAGKVLFDHAKKAVAEIEDAGHQIDAMNGVLQGTLTLATISLFGSKYLPILIDAFCTRHPYVTVKVRVARAEDIEEGLVAGTIDLGFSLTPKEHAEIEVRQLFEDENVLVVAKTHALASKKKVSVDELKTLHLALPSHKISSSRPMGTYFEAIGVDPRATVEQDDGHALLALVQRGNFVTCLPRFCVKDNPDFHYLTLPPPGMHPGVGAMWTQLNAASEAFLAVEKELNLDY